MEAAVSFCETTEVLFAALSPEEIRAYIRWVPYTQRPSAQILEDTGRDSAKSVARHAVPTLNLDPQTVVERVAVADATRLRRLGFYYSAVGRQRSLVTQKGSAPLQTYLCMHTAGKRK